MKNRIILTARLSNLNDGGYIKPHPSKDVVVIKVATTTTPPPGVPNPMSPPGIPAAGPSHDNSASQTSHQTVYVPGVMAAASKSSRLTVADRSLIKKYDEVLVGNDIIVYGYPRSLLFNKDPTQLQLDPLRPLLRRGLISGLNENNHTIILDCAVYRGNSGGPAVEIETDGSVQKLRVIGIVVEYVSLTEGSEDLSIQFNSGYSIVEPMDPILELAK